MTRTKWLIPFFVLFLFTSGCKHRSAASVPRDNALAHTLNAPGGSITGTWCGMFEPATAAKTFDKVTGDSIPLPSYKITLFIDQMEDGAIFGYSVCAGHDHPFRGEYSEDGDKITATLKESGDTKNDGVFDLVISKQPLSITGKWTPFNHSRTSRRYSLARRNFIYNDTAGQYSESSVKPLTADDLKNLYKDQLRVILNEIYARHGYSFKLRDMQELFDDQDWYMPISTNVRKKLTAIEIKNEELIKQFEKSATEDDDDFGR